MRSGRSILRSLFVRSGMIHSEISFCEEWNVYLCDLCYEADIKGYTK